MNGKNQRKLRESAYYDGITKRKISNLPKWNRKNFNEK